MFKTLVYLIIPKSNHIQNPAKYLKWVILLRNLCNNCNFRLTILKLQFRLQLYSEVSHIQNPKGSATV